MISAARQDQKLEFKQFILDEDHLSGQSVSDSLEKFAPDLILTVGSAATRIVREKFPDIPTIFAGVLYPVLSGFVESLLSPGQKITGASLNLPVETQFRYFKTIIPELKQVGVLYTAGTATLIDSAQPIAARMNLELVPIKVEHQKDIARALDSLDGVVQGIWALADPTLFNPLGTKFILLQSLRRGLPVMGFSRHLVESGALFGLDFDYKAVGRQAGEMAAAVLGGADPSQIPVSRPDIIWFHYNARTAAHLSIVIPDDLKAVAKEVYR